MLLKGYLENPFQRSPTRCWKDKQIVIHGNMRIRHPNDFSGKYLIYCDERYSRLTYDLNDIGNKSLEGYHIKTEELADIPIIGKVISSLFWLICPYGQIIQK